MTRGKRFAATLMGVNAEASDTAALLRAIDKKLHVLLAVAIADRVPDTSRAANRSLDSVLRASGLSLGEIGTLMGKSKQAVSQALNADAQRSTASRKGAGRAAARKGGSRG
jgi:hypothetical protein